jgi:hypothetical protein
LTWVLFYESADEVASKAPPLVVNDVVRRWGPPGWNEAFSGS